MRIYIKTLTGRIIPLDLEPGTTVHQVKTMIKDKEGIPQEQQRLIFNGKQLLDSRVVNEENQEFTMSDYAVPMEGEVHLVLALR